MSQQATAVEQENTRKRLLEQAASVFVEKGFRAATVRDICKRAGTNVAAVNYHFGNKQRLYRELILAYPEQTFIERPRDSWRREGMTPDELLMGFIHDWIARLLSPEKPAWHSILLAREIVEPTGVFDEILEQFIRPQVASLGQIVMAVAGRPLDEAKLWRCMESVIPQVMFHVHAQLVIKKLRPDRVYDEPELERMAKHIASFSAAGIRAVAGGAS